MFKTKPPSELCFQGLIRLLSTGRRIFKTKIKIFATEGTFIRRKCQKFTLALVVTQLSNFLFQNDRLDVLHQGFNQQPRIWTIRIFVTKFFHFASCVRTRHWLNKNTKEKFEILLEVHRQFSQLPRAEMAPQNLNWQLFNWTRMHEKTLVFCYIEQ